MNMSCTHVQYLRDSTVSFRILNLYKVKFNKETKYNLFSEMEKIGVKRIDILPLFSYGLLNTIFRYCQTSILSFYLYIFTNRVMCVIHKLFLRVIIYDLNLFQFKI